MSRFYVPISEIEDYMSSKDYLEYPKEKVEDLLATFKIDIEVDEPSVPVEMLVYTVDKEETEILQIAGTRDNILHNTRLNSLSSEGSTMTPQESIKEWVLITYSKHFEKFPNKIVPELEGVIIEKSEGVLLTVKSRVKNIRDFK